MKEYAKLGLATVCFMMLSVTSASPGQDTETLIMPPEPVKLAQQNGYTQITDFYDSCYCHVPPFVYGSQDDNYPSLEFMGAAFWCRKVADSGGAEDSYYLILASRPFWSTDLTIDTVVRQDYYPHGGFSLYYDTALALDSFVYLDDRQTTGPAGIKLKHATYQVIWDGATDMYYKHEGRWLIYKTWDW